VESCVCLYVESLLSCLCTSCFCKLSNRSFISFGAVLYLFWYWQSCWRLHVAVHCYQSVFSGSCVCSRRMLIDAFEVMYLTLLATVQCQSQFLFCKNTLVVVSGCSMHGSNLDTGFGQCQSRMTRIASYLKQACRVLWLETCSANYMRMTFFTKCHIRTLFGKPNVQ